MSLNGGHRLRLQTWAERYLPNPLGSSCVGRELNLSKNLNAYRLNTTTTYGPFFSNPAPQDQRRNAPL
jgi:hypothetical protein